MTKRRVCALLTALLCVFLLSAAFAEETPEAEPTMEPTVEPTPEPSAEPTAEPTPTPTAYPTLQLGSAGDEVTALQARLIALKYLEGTLEGMPTGTYDEATETAVKLFQKQNRLTETGIADDATQQALYAETAQEYNPNSTPGGGGFPSGGGGGMPSGGGSASGAGGTGEMAEEDGGITPGEALTSDHSSGDADMARYWAIEATASGEPQAQLTLGETALDITLADGAFIASIEGSVLTLTSDAGTQWTINGYALKILSISGIERVTLVSGGERVEIPTEDYLSGSAYAALRAQGLVSKDFTLSIILSGGARATVAAGDETYEADGAAMAVEGVR